MSITPAAAGASMRGKSGCAALDARRRLEPAVRDALPVEVGRLAERLEDARRDVSGKYAASAIADDPQSVGEVVEDGVELAARAPSSFASSHGFRSVT